MEEDQEPPSPSPLLLNPNSTSAYSIFKDISNFKTPKRPTQKPNPQQSPFFPHYFTASKQTPSSSSSAFRRRPSSSICPSSKSKAARRLKAFELEQSKSSRKAQINKQKSLITLSKSLSAWLNFLFENPKLCGCDVSVLTGGGGGDGVDEAKGIGLGNGKRDSGVGIRVSADAPWRSPKRQKDCEGSSVGVPCGLSAPMVSSLQVSLQEICSLEDLQLRMRAYLSLESCKGILTMMSQVAKNIDDGRLKMKAHCPIVTDMGMKDKATRILMSYNPTWLRIGLYIIFGGDSLLPVGDVNSDQEIMFLKMVIEKQFFAHLGLAKSYACNRLVDGLYRPGYFEALGVVILKRFLLLVLVLDRAKSLSSLPIKFGIDGTDGGSPLLFSHQSKIKSSRQVIQDFLSSEVMHGEGNLLAHLVMVGYKVSYQQNLLLEYDFRITDLFEDLQDGVRLCRAIQLLQRDASILMKLVVPSDNRKKNLVNCGVALQYLKQAGVSLSDEDGVMIVAEDVVTGEKELTLSMLWNMFVHLQLPLLINKMLLFEELSKVKGAHADYSGCMTSSHLELLFEWIQAICQKYDVKIDTFTSLVDGKAMWCLIDYYFRNELHSACSCEEVQNSSGEESTLWTGVSTDAVHNFILSQKLTTILGKSPEVLQISDILEHNGACNERSVIILLVFLSSQLIGKKHMDLPNIHRLLGCSYQSLETKSLDKCFLNVETPDNQVGLEHRRSEDSVKKFKIVQAWWRDMVKRNHNCETKHANSGARCHLPSQQSTDTRGGDVEEEAATIIQSHFRGSVKRQTFQKIKTATIFLQTVIRAWLKVKREKKSEDLKMQKFLFNQMLAATKIQSYWRGWLMRRNFMHQKKAIIKIQSGLRCVKCWRNFQQYKLATRSAIIIQSHFRGFISRREANTERYFIVVIQSNWRRSLMRKEFVHKREAAIKVQSSFRRVKCQKEFSRFRNAAIHIQRFVRGQIAHNRQLGASSLRSAVMIQSHTRGWIARREANKERTRITVIQAYWRGYIARKASKGKLLDLRLRVQKSAANVDDGMRLINRLVAALSELLNFKSVSNVLHTCTTLDVATQHSQKCCETLVAAGAIKTLLKLIRSVSRSIPDQEVLKHALSTLRNLAHYPNLAQGLIDADGSLELIFSEFLRNKEDGYFIASQLLKKLFITPKGIETIRSLPALLKRLHNLVEDLKKKTMMEKRNPRSQSGKDYNERRLKEAVELVKLINK